MRNLLKIFLVLSLCHLFNALTVSYKSQSQSAVINNPERGFYVHTEVYSKGAYESLDQDELNSYRTQNYTIILRVFYLENFLKTQISSAYLNAVKDDFNKIRAAGLKCIVRFAYSSDQNMVGSLDASQAQVIAHITQLKPLLFDHADIIVSLQAGFVGTWGEWYYTDNFGYPTPNYTKRKAVVDAILAALPASRMIQLRTPTIKQKLFSTTTPLSQAAAYSGTSISRAGHHNDCFLASEDDFGTYEDISKEYPYLEQETKYTAMGGETCALNKPRSDCPTALAEMKKFHWSYLNVGYHPDVIKGFRTNNCFTTIQNRLGYRFELGNGDYPATSSVKTSFSITLRLNNTGFSSPFNARKVYLVLKNIATNKITSILLKTNPNFWSSGVQQNITESVSLPAGFSPGNYKLYLNLPDSYASIAARPEYSIRFANEGVWEPATGFNSLLHTINLTA